jgi:hypothetical protein
MPLDEKRKGGVGGRWTPARSRSFGEGGGSGKGDDSASLIFPAHNSSPTS